MNYYASLAFQLRLRKLPEERIAEILQEVRDLSRESGQNPDDQFGPPTTYAEQFPMGNVRSRATRIAIAVLAVAIAAMALDVGMSLFRDERLEIGGVRVVLICFAVQAVAIIAALVADHRVPPRVDA